MQHLHVYEYIGMPAFQTAHLQGNYIFCRVSDVVLRFFCFIHTLTLAKIVQSYYNPQLIEKLLKGVDNHS